MLHCEKDINTNRVIWLDLLRIISVFAVIVLHAAAVGYGKFNTASDNWQWCNLYNALSRFCVPVLVMISGVFLLNPVKDYSIKKIFLHKIFHLAAAYILWVIFYSTIYQLKTYQTISLSRYLTTGPHHLWFLFMISGLYMITPILRSMTGNRKITNYFLTLTFILIFCLNTVSLVPQLNPLSTIINRLDLKFIAGFTSYFTAGYWLANHRLDWRIRVLIYELGILSLICTVSVGGLLAIRQGRPITILFDNFLLNIFFISIAVFTFFQYSFSNISVPSWLHNGISLLARYSFGVYLVHVLYLENLKFIGLPDFFTCPVVSIPVTAMTTWVLSLLTVCILSAIPICRKYAI